MNIPGYHTAQELGGTRRFRVFRARHAADLRPVLLKVPARLPALAQDVEALTREFALLRDLDGRGVPAAHELNVRGDVPCLVMEDRRLDPLAARLRSERPPLSWILDFVIRLCTVVGEIHEKGLVVGGLNPDSVLVDRVGTDVQLIDLTASSRPSQDVAPPLLPNESTTYISPEQTGRINRAVDYRSDFYSLGVTLYELLTGQPPCTSRDALEMIHFHIARSPAPPSLASPGVPEQVSHIVMRLLAKDADDRYQSARGIVHDLERCAQEWKAHGAIALFELGARDVSDRFLIPQRLYGRDVEVAALTRAFDDTCEGRTALLLVSGYSGVGKTSLINELYRPIVSQRGYFASGKCDQVVRNIPYGAMAQALRNLVRQFLTESEDRLVHWRARLSAALGTNSGVLAEVVPEIEVVLGKQEPSPPLDPAEAQNRFRYVFQSFVGTVADRAHPLVVFLDDLQWVDAATLELLQALLTSIDIRHLLLVGAYRDNEVDAGHLLSWTMARLDAAGAVLHRLSLTPLSLPDLLVFLCDTLRNEPRDIEPLARLILEKTDGNPFFVIQFLRTLVQDGFIEFDRRRGQWTFRVDAIQQAGMTDNVIDLMTRKIQRLSPRAQRAVTLAACIGDPFAWDTLLTVSRQAPDETAAGLAEALDAGLVRRTSVAYEPSDVPAPARVTYSFLHDRVQQAAYGLIPESQKRPAHLDVGRLLLADWDPHAADDRIFEIVNHLNVGRELITGSDERTEVAGLNLSAGRKAKTSTAYRPASTLLEHGIALLERATTDLDRAQVHALRMTLYENQSRWSDAVASGRAGLALFGISFPDRPEEKQAALDREVDATQHSLGSRDIASLVDLPVMADANVRMVMRLLTILWAPAYISGDELLARLISATMVRLSLAHGNTEDSAYGYVTHAITVGPIRRDYRSAYEWGELALNVNERFNDRKRRARIHQQFQAHVNLWRRPFETCIPHAREALRSGLETGDFPYAGYGAATEAWSAFVICRSLDRFVRDYTPTLALLEKVKMGDFLVAHKVILNWAVALQGGTSGPLTLSDSTFDEQAVIRKYQGVAPFFLTFLYTAKLHLALLLDDCGQALEAWRRAREVTVTGTMWPVLADAWGGLALAAGMRPGETGANWDQLLTVRDSLRELAEHCPDNFRCFFLLISGEIERLQLEPARASQLCRDAVAFARQTDNLQLEALSNERCAKVLLSAGDELEAIPFMKEAHRCYTEWGASVKARDLENRYERLLGPRPAAGPAERWLTTEPTAERDAVDMATVLKLARAIAVEIHLDDLLRRLMTIAMENAGARRSVFLVAREQELTVEAEAVVDPEQVHLRQAVPLERSDRVPQRIVQYVRRTGQDVVIGHAGSDERFGSDPYVSRMQPRSILCVPVSHQGRLGGILYLENDLTADAFTPQRTEMMRILAAQAAISLENARLYEEMKNEVDRRIAAEQALREALAEVQQLKDRFEAENVYLQEEIQTQHNFSEIVGNSQALLEALRKVERVAPTESTVLVLGETGSGKELFARAVHNRSHRRDRPLVKVNCGAIAPGLVESELFGHVRGAFTGAIEKRTGRFELAHRGTIFLDEIGELPLDAQVKLLRVLQEQEFEPVGSSRTVRVDVRVIAATNRDLDAAVREGRFRADLLYRLNVFPIAVPPLRDRRQDVPLLADFFMTGLARRLGKPIQGFSARSMARLMSYSWPGNVRELQNVIERVAILAQDPILELEPGMLLDSAPEGTASRPQRAETLEQIERTHISHVLEQTGGVVEGNRGAARLLGLHPNTLRSRMKKLGILPTSHRPS